MGGCFGKAQTPMTATKEDILALKRALTTLNEKEVEACEAMRELCALNAKFQGLIDPAASWKHNDISHGVTQYLEDLDDIAEDRMKRVHR